MDMLNELLRAYKGIQKLFTPLLNFSIEVMVLLPTLLPPIIIPIIIIIFSIAVINCLIKKF